MKFYLINSNYNKFLINTRASLNLILNLKIQIYKSFSIYLNNFLICLLYNKTKKK
jgi:hypothetical protein